MFGVLYFYTKNLFYLALASIPILFACSSPVAIEPTQKANPAPALQINLDENYYLKFKSGIRCILEDKQGNTWIASDKEGVCKYDGKTFTYFDYDDGLCNNQIRTIYEHPNGEIWFEGGYGLSYYNGKELITPKERNYNSPRKWRYPKDALWFKPDASTGHTEAEGGIGVYCYDGESLDYFPFPINPLADIDAWGYSVSTNFVKGKDGTTWFGTYNAVIGYDGSDFTFFENRILGLPNDNNGLHVRALFEDSKGTLWIGNNGIGILKQEGDKFINFSQRKGLTSVESVFKGISVKPNRLMEHIFAIGEDKEGNMWFGDRDTGAWRYDGQTMKNYTYMDGLTCMHISQIYNAKNAELWFAMGDGNVLKFEGERFVKVF